MAEMQVNAVYIRDVLIGWGWTLNAVAGLLGNTETESSHNPARWQSDRIGWTAGGYGLVQWTPTTKYRNWASAQGYSLVEMYPQLLRIKWEVENNEQWTVHSAYPMTFKQFIVSKDTPEYLAQVFLHNYEMPESQVQPARSTQARYWYDYLSGSTPNPPDPPDPPPGPDNPPHGVPFRMKAKCLRNPRLYSAYYGR